MKYLRSLGLVSILYALSLSSFAGLQPLLTQIDKVALQNDFSKSEPLEKGVWQKRQGTRWSIKNGVLLGLPSTAEYQASKPDHKGYEPRISCPATPAEFTADFTVRFSEGVETSIAPFVEFGHHIARVKFSRSGISLIADGETVKLDESQDFKYIPGKTYHIMAEMKGDEFVMQFADGPTLYGKHPRFALPVSSGGAGLGVTGPKGGIVEIDNLTLWTIKADPNPKWPAIRSSLPTFESVVLKEKKK